ncbi:discoidin domain-containing protein, partial [Pseudoflavonifractor capillosus]|uniref:discoidin domain-containing protein n=1 Tax=Pseudoflavonifractor capillosus TaxID=106588 RepID=UPI001958E9F2
MKKLGSLLLSAALVASLAVSASAFASGTQRAADAADGTWDYPWYKTTATAPSAQSGYLASNAVDGSSDTHWHTDWNTNLSDNEKSRYIQLDLGEVTEIKGLRYLPRQGTSQGNENGRIIDYRVEVSTTVTEDEGAWKEVVSGTWANNADWKIAEFTPVDARYVRLYGISTRGDTGNNKFVSGAEVRVQTTETEYTNIFLGKSARASTENSVSKEYASGANDGNTNTKWCADWNEGSNPDKTLQGNWWQVDLGARYTVDEMNIVFDAASNWQYYVVVSDDPSFADVTVPTENIPTLSNADRVTVSVGETGQHVRVYLKSGETGGPWPCLREVSGTGTYTEATYPITVINPDEGGTATANPTTAAAGDMVTLTPVASEGYHFVEWQVTEGDVTISEDNTFTMPENAVTITPVFAEHTYGEPSFTWTKSEDGYTATATFSCEREGCNHTETVDAEVSKV